MDTYDLRDHVAQRMNSGCQAWWYIPLPTVPSRWVLFFFFPFVSQGLATLFSLALNSCDPVILPPRPALQLGLQTRASAWGPSAFCCLSPIHSVLLSHPSHPHVFHETLHLFPHALPRHTVYRHGLHFPGALKQLKLSVSTASPTGPASRGSS